VTPNKKIVAFIRHQVVPLEQAFLHVSDLSIQRGYGIFDFFKILEGCPIFLENYLDRFYRSADLMQLPVPLGREELKEIIRDLIRQNDLPVSGMKLLLTGGYSPSGYDLAAPNLLLLQQTITLPDQDQVERGIRVITHEYLREIPAAKTINYTMGIRLLRELRERGADEVLYHLGGEVSEFPRSNVFIVKHDNTVVTPGRRILPGITRKMILLLASQNYQVEEGTVTLDDLRQAKEVFMTNTTRRILPVVQVDGIRIGDGKPGSITLNLLEELLALEKKQMGKTW
jgi:branched-chain amino acid aminotransferase